MKRFLKVTLLRNRALVLRLYRKARVVGARICYGNAFVVVVVDMSPLGNWAETRRGGGGGGVECSISIAENLECTYVIRVPAQTPQVNTFTNTER